MTDPTGASATSVARDPSLRTFRLLLLNTLVSGVTSSFLWFALTFWVYLETRSVVATGVIGGAFSISAALLGIVFGTYVDHHRKKQAMVLATTVSAACFAIATAVFVVVDSSQLLRLTSPWFWTLAGVTLLGSVAGQMRGIALSTCVTLLVPEQARDRANGLVGTVTGVSLAITSCSAGLSSANSAWAGPSTGRWPSRSARWHTSARSRSTSPCRRPRRALGRASTYAGRSKPSVRSPAC